MRFPDAGGTKVIYFDSAATTLQKLSVILVMPEEEPMMPLYIVCEWLMKPER